MIQVAILTRRLKEGKTYEDFRKAWYHTVGFGAQNRMYTVINAFDPREIIVIGMTEFDLESLTAGLQIDVKERLANPLDEVIEPEIGRTFGILVSEDDFSADGEIACKPASVGGVETDIARLESDLSEVARMIAEAAAQRDRALREKDTGAGET
jgi:hypothetical protein